MRGDAAAPGSRRRRGDRRRDGQRGPPVHLTLLGGFGVRTGQAPSALPRGARRPLALVALSPRGVSRQRASALLYPHLQHPGAGGTLRSSLSRLRRALPGALDASGALLRLTDRVVVDARELERLALELAAGEGPPAEDLDLARLTDELLPGWEDDWVVLERDRLQDVCLEALERAAGRFSSGGRPAHARAAIHRALLADPLRESTVRALIEIELAAGNRARAAGHFLRFRRRLRAALGIAPSPLLVALVAELLDGDAAGRG